MREERIEDIKLIISAVEKVGLLAEIDRLWKLKIEFTPDTPNISEDCPLLYELYRIVSA